MKHHTTIGHAILVDSPSKLLQVAAQIALTHHEKWDGSGYPHGRKEEEIPLVGRIVAVADVFDALTSERPYKKAWPVAEAKEHIIKENGRHFDPACVDAFLEMYDAILKVKDRYHD
jgi:putative two-component system response regulator